MWVSKSSTVNTSFVLIGHITEEKIQTYSQIHTVLYFKFTTSNSQGIIQRNSWHECQGDFLDYDDRQIGVGIWLLSSLLLTDFNWNLYHNNWLTK